QCRLFGSVHQQGRLRFEDAEVQGEAPARKMDHVAIDRYTGGGVDRLKFDDYPLTPGKEGALTLKGGIWIRGALSKEETTALTLALSELKSGLISLGGLGAIGYGRVKTFEITRGADILDPPEWRFHPVPGAGRVSMKPPPGPGIAPGKIYHPHYFIPPAPRLVEREASPASHAMDADHEGAPLFSGKLACTLTTRGPIFIPDAANDDYFNMNGEKAGGKEEHKNYGFFRYNGKPAIPGASIRGMISSVYETLTHSCYRVMDAKKYITRRVRPESEGAKTGKKGRVVDADADVDLEPGRVIKRGDKWVVAPMGESVRLPLYDVKNVIDGVKAHKYRGNGRFYKQKLNAAIQYNHLLADAAAQNRAFLRGMDWEQRIAVLEGREPIYFEVRRQERRLKSGRQKEVNPNARFGVLTSSTKNTQRGYIKYTGPDMVNVNKIPKTNSPFEKAWEDWNPFDINALPLHNEIEARPSQRQEYPRPVLACVRNKVEYRMYKRCERVFTEPAAGAAELPIPETVVKQFRDILEDNGDNTEKIPDVFKSRLQKTGLRDSELVYYKLDKAKGRVTSLAPVCISREVDQRPLGKRFPDIEINGQRKPNDSLQPCTHTCLEDCEDCPSLCEKVKDYFHPHPDGLCPACHLFGTPYYRGRVGFGFARLAGAAPRWCVPPEKDGPGGGPLTLPLLERPRPTWSMPEGDSRIPGRKYYVHHPLTVERIKRRRPGSGVDDEIDITPNNRTVEPLAEENAFTFSVTFHNLRAWELGLLVYSLELEDGLAHKLGMAKSMGLGSVRIEATNLQLKHAPASEMDKHTLIREGFKKLGLSDLQTTDFTGLTHIKQLREMLWLPEDETNALVRYPELESKDKTIPGYVDMVRKQIPESGANNPKYLEPRVRLGILQTPWRPWHSRG
ncbi:MAG: TIGR03986 family CRISPR-associated RAMP protein, partial [Desulfobacterales bacterium]|nr:TIGR03986 family CRISPR-associated RAMP protein [Desulfobacterales bacterium]